LQKNTIAELNNVTECMFSRLNDLQVKM
jgi:hypothetical protein